MWSRSKFIKFVETEKKGRTSVWAVVNIKSGTTLGLIKWYGPWRQYCFLPTSHLELVFSSGCLDDINKFIDGLKKRGMKNDNQNR